MLVLTTSRGDLIIILGDENIERIKEQDPVQINWKELPIGGMLPRSISVTYGTPEDEAEIERLAGEGKHLEAAAYATRGFTFRPELGDSRPISSLDKPRSSN